MTDVVVHPSGVEHLNFSAARDFVVGERIRDINVVREVTPASALRPEFGERSDPYGFKATFNPAIVAGLRAAGFTGAWLP